MFCQIEEIKTAEIALVKNILKEAGLPFEDIDQHSETFLTAKVGNEIVGAVGLEIWNDNGLLRSLVVKKNFRNYGFGNELYAASIDLAKQNNLKQVVLLTTTAEQFFSKKGFTKVTGNNIPSFVKATKEYIIYCPSSSVIMMKQI